MDSLFRENAFLNGVKEMANAIQYSPLKELNFFIATELIPVGPDTDPRDLWRLVHTLTMSASSYCSERRIHPAAVCAWFGAGEPSECYNEAAMLAAMALLETLKGGEYGS